MPFAFALHEFGSELSVIPLSEVGNRTLSLESTLQDLPLYDFQIELSQPAKIVAQAFEANPLLPGVILTDQENFIGIISRRLFFERIGRRYGLEMFFQRPIEILYRFSRTDILLLPGTALIVESAQHSLERPAELLYDPIVVEVAPQTYRLLDVHQLLVAQSKIHELTNRLLQKQTQAKIIQTEKMASLGRMVAGVAHEIRNPLNCIWGNLTFLISYFEGLMCLLNAYEEENAEPSSRITQIKEDIEFDCLQEDLSQTLEGIQVGSEQLLKVVNGLHQFSHMDETQLREADLRDCMDSTLLILKSRLKKGIEVTKNYGDVPRVNCYSGQLSQVFMNLLVNAIDALGERAAQLEESEAQNWRPQINIVTEVVEINGTRWAAVRIADNGPGISPEIQQRIFDTFFTTKPAGKGTGLGLAISHQIITEKHRGKLNLNSHPGQGTEFEILLPLGVAGVVSKSGKMTNEAHSKSLNQPVNVNLPKIVD